MPSSTPRLRRSRLLILCALVSSVLMTLTSAGAASAGGSSWSVTSRHGYVKVVSADYEHKLVLLVRLRSSKAEFPNHVMWLIDTPASTRKWDFLTDSYGRQTHLYTHDDQVRCSGLTSTRLGGAGSRTTGYRVVIPASCLKSDGVVPTRVRVKAQIESSKRGSCTFDDRPQHGFSRWIHRGSGKSARTVVQPTVAQRRGC